MCFEILGFDIMFDHALKPWLIEVNHAPSFATDSELDSQVKRKVLQDCFTLLNLSPETKKRFKKEVRQQFEKRAMGKKDPKDKKLDRAQRSEGRYEIREELAKQRTEWEENNCGDFRKLYPTPEKEEKYAPHFESALHIWETLTGAQTRKPIASRARRKEEEEAREAEEKAKAKAKAAASKEKLDKAKLAKAQAALEPMTVSSTKTTLDEDGGVAGSGDDRGDDNDTDSERQDGFSVRSSELPPSCQPAGGSGDRDPAAEDTATPTTKKKSRPRPDVLVGEVVRVQTNLGWERVVVRRKHSSGRVDIQFEDGELMRQVLPRILKATTAPAPKEDALPPATPPPNSDRGPARGQPSLLGQSVSSLRAQQARSDFSGLRGRPTTSSPGAAFDRVSPRIRGSTGALAGRAPVSCWSVAAMEEELAAEQGRCNFPAAADPLAAYGRPPHGSGWHVNGISTHAAPVFGLRGDAVGPNRRGTSSRRGPAPRGRR
mmetsp:Transcript_9425/g.23908  ORF Transcript_9425/g.23908 Transcript_9425/m.23908 type:complete len:488 (-) Transcript_9425:18-1481(-)